jgi:hypothetical protein
MSEIKQIMPLFCVIFRNISLCKLHFRLSRRWERKVCVSTTPWRRIGECNYNSRILDLSTRRRWVVSFTPHPLYPLRSNPQYSLDRKLDQFQFRSGRCGVKSWSYPLTGRGGPYGYETSRLPYFLDNRLTHGGEVVSLTHQPPTTPRKIPGTHFC